MSLDYTKETPEEPLKKKLLEEEPIDIIEPIVTSPRRNSSPQIRKLQLVEEQYKCEKRELTTLPVKRKNSINITKPSPRNQNTI
jgi:hypothetical protein